jgi:hypothetical protein
MGWISKRPNSRKVLLLYTLYGDTLFIMFKLQTKVSVVKMSQYSAIQRATQTYMKPIAFKQNRINF